MRTRVRPIPTIDDILASEVRRHKARIRYLLSEIENEKKHHKWQMREFRKLTNGA